MYCPSTLQRKSRRRKSKSMSSTTTKITKKELQKIGLNQIVCRSNYKMHCYCCNRTIRRGDLITQVVESGGMRLRPVNHGPKGCGYIPETGSRWVHLDCSPRGKWTGYSAYSYALTH